MRRDAGRVLIVDDEVNIRQGLHAILSKNGHTVRDSGSAEEAYALLNSFECEVAILDIQMPGASGVDLLERIRAQWPHISVIMLTGHGTLASAMAAVKAGAHDYLLKPAGPDEIRHVVTDALASARRRREQEQLLTSLRLGLQRLGELPGSHQLGAREEEVRELAVGGLTINLQSHQVHRDDEAISLTPTEFNLLVTMAKRAGEVIDYVALVAASLAYEAEPWEAKELIKRHIFTLRHKIEPDPKSPQYILNVRGVGYRLANPQNLDLN